MQMKINAFKCSVPFRSCISKVSSILIDNSKVFYIVMPMYDMLEYSQKLFHDIRSLWNYYRDEIDNVNDNALDSKEFKYQTKIVGKNQKDEKDQNDCYKNPDGTHSRWSPQPPVPALNAEVTIPFKYLSTFWRFLDLPLINCKIELDLSWTKNCVLIENHDNITGINFTITSTKLYVLVVTLLINDNIKFLENIKQKFKR